MCQPRHPNAEQQAARGHTDARQLRLPTPLLLRGSAPPFADSVAMVRGLNVAPDLDRIAKEPVQDGETPLPSTAALWLLFGLLLLCLP